jgi:hypothetical protein
MSARRWTRPKASAWVRRAKSLLEESEPLSKQSKLRLLKSAVREYDLFFEVLSRIAERSTTDEGDKEATEKHFGLDLPEIIQMAHDDMIVSARLALRNKR